MKHSTNENSELMTVNEVSKYLRISRASVYRLARERKIPVSRIGKHLRFRKVVIDEWLTHMEKKNSYQMQQKFYYTSEIVHKG